MAIVKVENKSYTVEPLYQWDLNQVLEIRGLSMHATPEVHFTNEIMARAIRRFATMDATGVIRVEVPNALLQTTCRIKALVCIREGEVFKTYHELQIPVKGRAQPADYTITDDQDIYSFLELENLVRDSVASMEKSNAEAKRQASAATNTANAAATTANAAATTANGIAADAADAKRIAEGSVAKVLTVSLTTENWTGDGSPYFQDVELDGYEATANTRVDINPSPEVIAQAMNDGFALVFENNGGDITAHAIGEKPTADLIVQVSALEVFA